MKRFTRIIVLLVIAFVILPFEGFVVEAEATEVFLGGELIGISTLSEGLYVTDICEVTTKNGTVKPLEYSGIKTGDIILSVNGNIVRTRNDVKSLLKKGVNKLELITIEGKKEVLVEPVVDVLTNDLRLGVYLDGSIEGIGTLTYVTEEGRFSCLGHLASFTDTPSLVYNGGLYKAEFLGTERSKVGLPGKINGLITREKIGTLAINSFYGVYGKINTHSLSIKIPVASRFSVSAGKASMYCNIDGEVKEYSIEILSAYVQPTVKEKGLTIKITDERIINNLGGIVQGMSGSPIVQNGKLIGAVTHVVVDEPSKGYGIYADFLIDIGKKVQ